MIYRGFKVEFNDASEGIDFVATQNDDVLSGPIDLGNGGANAIDSVKRVIDKHLDETKPVPQGQSPLWEEVNCHQFMDGTGNSYHLLVPAGTPMVAVVRDKDGFNIAEKPVGSMNEFTKYKLKTEDE